MEFYDTFDENGIFLSSEDENDVHYKGLWHKVIRVWLYDKNGNLYLRVRRSDKKCDCINELHMRSSESISGCFDRGMFEKLGIHFPASSDLIQVCTRRIKKHKVYSDNSELKDNYILCDYIGEFDNNTNFFIFSSDTDGIVVANAKGILNLLKNRTGEVLCHKVHPSGKTDENKQFLKITDIFEDSSEDSYEKYSYVVNCIDTEMMKHKKEAREAEKLRKLTDKVSSRESEEFVSHADENDGVDIY